MYAFVMTWSKIKNDRRAVTALEYGLVAALIAAVIVTSVTALGTKLDGIFTAVTTAL